MRGVSTKLRVPRSRDTPKRCVANLTGLPGRAGVFSHANTIGNMTWALRERVCGTVTDGVWHETIRPPGDFATPHMHAIRDRVQKLVGYASPITHDEYCAKYAGARRAAYERARDSLLVRPLTRFDAALNCFLKAEKWTEEKAPRVISPRDARFLLSMGVYISVLEHPLYRAFKRMHGSPVIMKGLDQEARAAVAQSHWNSFRKPVAVGLDASKFDQHTSIKALMFEHGFYLRPYRNNRDLQKLCSWQLRNRCFAQLDDGKVKWTTAGGRMSGDVNTALGNCVLSATMLLAYARERGIAVRVMVDGDDCVAFMEEDDLIRFLDGLATWYLARGYRMKVEGPYRALHEVEFCQSRWMLLNGTPLFVRNVYKALNQDHTWVERGGISHADVLTATGLGGLSIYGNVPVLGAYYRMLAGDRQLSSRVRKRLDMRSSWLRWAKLDGGVGYAEPTDSARLEFYRTFGMHAADQRDLERIYLAAQITPARSCDPNQITNVDTLVQGLTPTVLLHITHPKPI